MIDRFHHLYIRSDNFDASVAFYRDVLGWEVTQTWGGNGMDRGAMLSGGAVKVVIAERDPGEPELPNVHLDIHDIDARFKRMPAGDHVVKPPEKTEWGTRWFVVKDPDGNMIAFEEVHGRGG